MEYRRNKDLDKLRAFAVLLVMIVHFPRFKSIVPNLDPWSGVDLFFVISGYIVSKTFCRRLEENRELFSTTHAKILYTVAFYIKRFFRLTPPVLAALIIYFTAGALTSGSSFFSTFAVSEELFAIFTYQYNFFAAFRPETFLTWHWSLSAEEQFYAVFPFFVFLIPRDRYRLLFLLFLICLLTFIIRPFGLLFIEGSPGAVYLPQFRSDGLLYGIIVFLVAKRTWNKSLNPSFLKNRLIGNAVTSLLIAGIAFAPKLSFSVNSAIFTIGVLSSILVWISTFDEDYILPTRLTFIDFSLDWIGTRSYGIYLLHVPMIRIQNSLFERLSANGLDIPYPAKLLIMILALVATTEIMYRFIEIPIQRFGGQLAKPFLINK